MRTNRFEAAAVEVYEAAEESGHYDLADRVKMFDAQMEFRFNEAGCRDLWMKDAPGDWRCVVMLPGLRRVTRARVTYDRSGLTLKTFPLTTEV